MRYRLRTLLIVFAVGPPTLATIAQQQRSSLDRDAPALTLPKPEDVDQIVASRSAIPGLPGRERILEIATSEPDRLNRLLAFMTTRNRGWWTPWDTLPSVDWTIVVMKNKRPVLSLWVGPGWLGGQDAGKTVPRLHELSQEDRGELFRIIGLPKD
jgi:hypothetical protein